MSEANILSARETSQLESKLEMIRDTNLGKGLFARVLFGFICLKVIVLLITFYLANTLNAYLATITGEEITGSSGIMAKMGSLDGLFVLALLIGLLGVILFFIWIYFSVKNRNEINPGNRKYSPLVACFSFLIPIVNLVMPILVMIDLWAGSIREMVGKASPKSIYGTSIAVIWWLFFLVEIGFIAMNFSLRVSENIGVSGYSILVGRTGITALIGVINAVCLLQLIAGIEKRQQDAAGPEE